MVYNLFRHIHVVTEMDKNMVHKHCANILIRKKKRRKKVFVVSFTMVCLGVVSQNMKINFGLHSKLDT